MTSRERFEAWIESLDGDKPVLLPNGQYEYGYMTNQYVAWQAAERQALERAKELCLAREARVQKEAIDGSPFMSGFLEGIRTGARHCACEISDELRALMQPAHTGQEKSDE
ncbi:hypothetical protein [Caballeronia sp. LZ001]|uniref:hypothetical protein n=1 Tax=Caballeronia sp. LZ001 TaxID=3038553 RepID=UPI00285E225F|nr:hypothetical protein [Caballeronia sp. LZ001]MDR5801149.1 hypothetical protein [Caballeronia sp. LZ001]